MGHVLAYREPVGVDVHERKVGLLELGPGEDVAEHVACPHDTAGSYDRDLWCMSHSMPPARRRHLPVSLCFRTV